MTADAKCEKHLFEDATGMCRTCRGYFCDDCLVHAYGPHSAPLCIPCALVAAGVKSGTRSPKRRFGFGRRAAMGVVSTAAVLAVTAVSALAFLL